MICKNCPWCLLAAWKQKLDGFPSGPKLHLVDKSWQSGENAIFSCISDTHLKVIMIKIILLAQVHTRKVK